MSTNKKKKTTTSSFGNEDDDESDTYRMHACVRLCSCGYFVCMSHCLPVSRRSLLCLWRCCLFLPAWCDVCLLVPVLINTLARTQPVSEWFWVECENPTGSIGKQSLFEFKCEFNHVDETVDSLLIDPHFVCGFSFFKLHTRRVKPPFIYMTILKKNYGTFKSMQLISDQFVNFIL